MAFLNKDGEIYTSAKDKGNGQPITEVELYGLDKQGNRFAIEVDGNGNLKTISKLDLTTLVENGTVFIAHHEYTIPNGATVYMQYNVGNKLLYGLERNVLATGSITMKLWENPTFTTGNTQLLLPPTNLNRRLQTPITSATNFFANPTNVNTTGATLISYDVLYSSGKGLVTGLDIVGGTRLLKQNTSYILEITNRETQTINVSVGLLYYEI